MAKRTDAVSAEPVQTDYVAKSQDASVSRLFRAPRWYLRLRLRGALHGIERLERQLADEFGLAETAPIHEELALLVAERDALLKRVADRA